MSATVDTPVRMHINYICLKAECFLHLYLGSAAVSASLVGLCKTWEDVQRFKRATLTLSYNECGVIDAFLSQLNGN